MRKLLIAALLVTAAATPALAAPSDSDEARAERQQEREDRQKAREERRGAREQVRSDSSGPAVEPRRHRAPVSSDESRQVELYRAERAARLNGGDAAEARRELRQQRIENRNEAREERIETRRANRELRQAERPAPNVFRPRVPVVSNTPRIGTQPPPRVEARRHAPVNWSQHWRKDRRYNWYDWRRRNRWLFNLGLYMDPFGWGYRPYSIGWRMWPSYYGSHYWLNDPWQYRLPYAPPGYRWIRYYDDAILIDTWDGRVVDVIYNFFW